MGIEAFRPNRAYLTPSLTPDCQQNVNLTAAPQFVAFGANMKMGANDSLEISCDGGTGLAFVFSDAAVTNLTYGNGVVVLANQSKCYTVPPGCTGITVIGASASGTMRMIPGSGL